MLTKAGFMTMTKVSSPPTSALMPHSVEAEQALLGALLIDPEQMLNVSYLQREDFFIFNNGLLYDAMLKLFRRHNGYDSLTVTECLKASGHLEDIGGQVAIYDLINATPTSFGAPEYAAIVYKASIARQTINAATQIAQAAYTNVESRSGADLVNEAVDMLAAIDATRNVSSGPRLISSGIDALLDQMEQIESSGSIAGLSTGIRTIDHNLGGLQDDSLYLLAGRPGMGKSGLALQIAYNIARRGQYVLFFALEMSDRAVAARLVSSISGVPYESYNRPGVADWPKVANAADQVNRLPLLVDTTPNLSPSQIRSITQKMMIKYPIRLVVVDHGGIVSPEKRTGNEYQDQSQVALGMKNLPKQLNCPILCLLQLSRQVENQADHRPKMHHLRETGKWEENADGILFWYRDEVYNPDTQYPGIGELIIEKNRGGKRGTSTIAANMALNRFTDLEMIR